MTSVSTQPRQADRTERRCSDFSDVALPELPDIPGMICVNESRYLYWLTSRWYRGVGAVVEVGTWLGRSTSHLAAGLLKAGFDDALHCYDRFEWNYAFDDKTNLGLKHGDSFQPHFEKNIRPIYPNVRVTASPLRDIAWTGGPIEILFLDAPKRLAKVSDTLAAFGDSLIPGESLIVMQDYLHFPSFELATVLSCLGDRIELLHEVRKASTVAFRVMKPIDYARAQPVEWDFHHWTPEQAREAWDRIMAPLGAEARDRISPGFCMLLHDLGDTEGALEAVERLGKSDDMRKRWRRHAKTSLYDRYEPLFRAFDLGRVGKAALRDKERRRRKAQQKRRRAIRRSWRVPYLKLRQAAARVLRKAGLKS